MRGLRGSRTRKEPLGGPAAVTLLAPTFEQIQGAQGNARGLEAEERSGAQAPPGGDSSPRTPPSPGARSGGLGGTDDCTGHSRPCVRRHLDPRDFLRAGCLQVHHERLRCWEQTPGRPPPPTLPSSTPLGRVRDKAECWKVLEATTLPPSTFLPHKSGSGDMVLFPLQTSGMALPGATNIPRLSASSLVSHCT